MTEDVSVSTSPSRPSAHTSLQVSPVPQEHVDDRSTEREVVAHLGDCIRGSVAWQADSGQLGGVKCVLRGKNRGLVV